MMASTAEPVKPAGGATIEASAQKMGASSEKSAKRFQNYIRGVHTIVGTQDYLRKSAKSSLVLFGRDHETAEATKTVSFKVQLRAEELYNKYMKKWILAPDGRFRRRWDLLQMLCMLYISIVIPFRVGLGASAEGGWYIFELTIDAYFYLDLIINFLTGHQYADGALIMVPKDVAFHYLKTWFPLDFVACLPVDLILRVVQGTFYCSLSRTCHHKISTAGMLFRLLKILRLFKLIKLVRLFSIRRLLDRYHHDLFLVLPFLSVAQMFIVILFLGHLYACFFYYFSTSDWRTPAEKRGLAETLSSGTSTDSRRLPWIISEFGGEYGTPGSMGLASRYIGALYWAFATLCTVGYGDISAKTEGERVFAIVSMITGGFVFSGVIAKIGSLVAKVDAAKTAHNDKMDAVTAFIREHKMPRDLRSQVLIFFTKQQVRAYNVRTILSQMPYDLRSSILLYLYRDIIKKVPFFDGTDDIFITDVCLRLKPATYAAGTYIYTTGEIGRDLLVVVKGEVEVLGPQKQVTRVLYEGSYFGEGCILGDVRRMESVRARTPCSLCVLEADDLEELLINYPEMDQMLRRVYSRRKQHFKSAATSFSSVPSPGPRRRHSTDPNGTVPRAAEPADALHLLAGGLKPAANPPPGMDLRAIARLSRSATNGPGASEWSGPETSLGKEEATLLSESLGFGSPPQTQESPGSEAESKGWKPMARLFKNQVVPEELTKELKKELTRKATNLRADPALGGASTDAPEKTRGGGNEPEEGRTRVASSMDGVTTSGTGRIGSVTEPESSGNGGGSPTGHRRRLSAQAGGQEKWANGGNLKLVVNGDSDTGDTGGAENLDAGHSDRRSPKSQELPGIMSFRRRSSTQASLLGVQEPSTGEAAESGTSSGLSGLRAELRNLRHEVKVLRTEHRQDAALVQEQYKAIMSLLLKVSRQTVSGQGSDNDFFVHHA